MFPIFFMRRDARRRFDRIVSHDVPRLLFASFTFRCSRRDVRRRDALRRFSASCPVASRGSPAPNLASFGSVRTIGVATLALVSNVVSNGFPRRTCAKYGVFWQRRDARRLFSSVVSIWIRGSPVINATSFGGLAAISVGFPALCPLVSFGPSAQKWCLVAASRRWASRHRL
jgi:hypothetical protein